MEEYFKFKSFFEFRLPFILIGICVAVFIVMIVRALIIDAFFRKKVDILKKAGFERDFKDVASVGGGETWWYVRNDKRDRILEEQVYRMSVKEIKDFVSQEKG